jgi:hypothetical protein
MTLGSDVQCRTISPSRPSQDPLEYSIFMIWVDNEQMRHLSYPDHDAPARSAISRRGTRHDAGDRRQRRQRRPLAEEEPEREALAG